HAVARLRLDRLALARHDLVAGLEAIRREDVGPRELELLVARIFDERDAGAAVRVVLDLQNRGLDAVALALEVDVAVALLVAAAAEARRDHALEVPPALLLLGR